MDRQRVLLQLTQQLSSAGQAEDWDEMARINALIHAALPDLAALGPLTPHESGALAVLRELHGALHLRCVRAKDDVAGQIRELQDNKEGLTAYALESLMADTGN